jgi:hypothetical protein
MREIKYTTRFRRDYRREKSGRYRKQLDALLMEVVNLLAADKRSRTGISITRWPANGATIATAISSPISFSSTASRMMTTSSSCVLAHMASLACETRLAFRNGPNLTLSETPFLT